MKACFIGAGIIAEDHLKAARANSIEICGITSRSINAKKFADKNGISKSYNDPVKMIEETRPDAIYLLTPPSSYQEILNKIYSFKLPLFIEKPLGINCAEALAIESQLPKICFVGLNRRFYSYVDALKAEIKNHTNLLAQALLAERKKDYINRPSSEQNAWLTLNGIHFIDLLLYLFGQPQKIHFRNSWGTLPDQKFAVVYTTSLGHEIQLSVNLNSPGGWRIIASGIESEMQIHPLEKCIIKNLEGITELGDKSLDKDLKPGFYEQHRIFKEAVEKSACNHPKWSSFKDALVSMRFIEDVFYSQ